MKSVNGESKVAPFTVEVAAGVRVYDHTRKTKIVNREL